MAKGEAGESIDPLAFTKIDKAHGARILDPEQKGWENRKPSFIQQRSYRYPGGVRDRLQMAQMKAGMASLWSDGESYRDIAEKISDKYNLEGDERISANGIHYHIKQMLAYWRQKGLALMDERQAIILARFDQIESLAVEAYFASMEGKRTYHKNKQIEKARSKGREKQLLDKERDKRREHLAEDKRRTQQDLFIDTGELSDMEEMLRVTAKKIQTNMRHEENQAGDPKFLNIIFAVNRERAKILGLYDRKNHDDADAESVKLTDEQRQLKIATIISAAKERRSQQANMLADPAPLGGFEDSSADGNGHVPEITNPDEVEIDWGFGDKLTVPDVVEIQWD